MKDMLQGKRFLGALGTSLLLALAVCGPAFGQQAAQQIQVSGKVTAPDGEKIRGASVRIRGTTTSAVTDDEGKYSLTRHGASRHRAARGHRHRLHDAAAGRRHGRRGHRGRRGHFPAVLDQRAAAARWPGVRRDRRGRRVSRFTHHRADPGRQLISEQRPAVHRGRDARAGHVPQLVEPERDRIHPGPEGCLGGVDLRLAREQRRRHHRNAARQTGTAADLPGRQKRCGDADARDGRHPHAERTRLLQSRQDLIRECRNRRPEEHLRGSQQSDGARLYLAERWQGPELQRRRPHLHDRRGSGDVQVPFHAYHARQPRDELVEGGVRVRSVPRCESRGVGWRGR